MKIGLQIPDFTTPDGPPRLGADLATVARTADEGGFEFIAVMDHFFQIASVGPPEHEMLEAYTTLGYLAACTSRAKLLTLVTGAVYRHPGILAKTVTTLDVLSGGRAWLGIGAAWFEREHRALGVPFPPTGERMGRLEEAIRICLQMWSDDDGPFEGRYYRLAETLCSPPPVSKPRPPIMIGGGGEQRTLRLVARYADACNLFDIPDGGATIRRKLAALARHCDAVGRDYADIDKTVSTRLERDEPVDSFVARCRALAALGIDHAVVLTTGAWTAEAVAVLGAAVPELSPIGPA